MYVLPYCLPFFLTLVLFSYSFANASAHPVCSYFDPTVRLSSPGFPPPLVPFLPFFEARQPLPPSFGGRPRATIDLFRLSRDFFTLSCDTKCCFRLHPSPSHTATVRLRLVPYSPVLPRLKCSPPCNLCGLSFGNSPPRSPHDHFIACLLFARALSSLPCGCVVSGGAQLLHVFSTLWRHVYVSYVLCFHTPLSSLSSFCHSSAFAFVTELTCFGKWNHLTIISKKSHRKDATNTRRRKKQTKIINAPENDLNGWAKSYQRPPRGYQRPVGRALVKTRAEASTSDNMRRVGRIRTPAIFEGPPLVLQSDGEIEHQLRLVVPAHLCVTRSRGRRRFLVTHSHPFDWSFSSPFSFFPYCSVCGAFLGLCCVFLPVFLLSGSPEVLHSPPLLVSFVRGWSVCLPFIWFSLWVRLFHLGLQTFPLSSAFLPMNFLFREFASLAACPLLLPRHIFTDSVLSLWRLPSCCVFSKHRESFAYRQRKRNSVFHTNRSSALDPFMESFSANPAPFVVFLPCFHPFHYYLLNGILLRCGYALLMPVF